MNRRHDTFADLVWLVVALAVAALAACGADASAPDRADDGAQTEAAGATASGAPADVLRPAQPFVSVEPGAPARGPAGDAATPVRIAYTHIQVVADGDIARTRITEVMVNDLDSPAEASFTFPLPDDAAVTGFADWRDGERVEAAIAGKDDARAEFERAAERGERAALAEEDRGRVFSISLAPIAPRGQRRVELTYTQTLTALGGERSYALPAARFGERAPTLLDVEIELSGTRTITSARSLNHADARITRVSDTRMTAHLSRTRQGLGHDLVIQWNQPADDFDLDARAVAGAADEPGYVEARFAFNRDPWVGERPPVTAALVIDASLSMAGDPLARAQELAAQILDGLGPRDRVALVSFASEVRTTDLGPVVGAGGVAHRAALDRELAGLVARGHSNLAGALDEAANLLRGQPGGLLVVMTDGQPTVGAGVGADDELAAIPGLFGTTADKAGEDGGDGMRAVIAHFNYPTRAAALDAMLPNATRRFVPDGDAGDEVIAALARLAVAPVIEGLAIEIAGAAEGTVHGADLESLRRLAMGESARVLARADGDVTVTVRGALRGRPIALERRVAMPARPAEAGTGDRPGARSGVAVEWARLRIRDLEAKYLAGGDSELAREIRALGERYELATRFTSFVSTDRLAPDRIKPGDPEIRVHAPRSALGVFAVLPWGEVATGAWHEDEGVWLARFLVPRGTPDGMYRVRVFVASQEGTALRTTLYYRVDSAPPTFALTARYARGELTLIASPVDAVFDRKPGGDEIRLSHVDLKQVSVRVGDRDVALARTDELEWSATLPVALAPGKHTLVLVARDWAANTSRTEAVVEVAGGAAE